jgi:lipoate-protein ligase A
VLIINRPQTNPWFNIAAEEYLLKTMQEDCFMLWQNDASVIVGKHQNTMAEINHRFVRDNNIPVIRRISGGGTVFHDLGNLNFSFIQQGERGKLVDFQKFTQPILEVLNQLGVPAKFEGKNDLRVHGLKISGNAEHVYKNKVLHHGTLLFSSELGKLNEAIHADFNNYTDKAVKSVRSTVANISDFLNEPILIDNFKNHIFNYIQSRYTNVGFYDLRNNDIAEIEKLVNEKYKTWRWNYAYSPVFTKRKIIEFEGDKFEIVLKIKNGKVESIDFDRKYSNFRKIAKLLPGSDFEMMYLRKILIKNNISNHKILLESLLY